MVTARGNLLHRFGFSDATLLVAFELLKLQALDTYLMFSLVNVVNLSLLYLSAYLFKYAFNCGGIFARLLPIHDAISSMLLVLIDCIH